MSGSPARRPCRVNGHGPLPTHVSWIHAEPDGRYRLQIHQRGTLRSQLGFHRELVCADRAAYDEQMELLIAARVPFMVGHMSPGASDDAYFWLKEKQQPVDYLEIYVGGKTEWGVREIVDDASEWRGVKADELLGPEIDLFDPANRPLVPRPDPPPAAAAAPVAAPTEPPVAQPAAPPPTAPRAVAATPEAPSPPAPELDEAASAAAAPDAAAPDASPAAEPAIAAAAVPAAIARRRRVDWISALVLLALLFGTFWRAIDYRHLVVLADPGALLGAVLPVGLAGGATYAALWILLARRHFARWPARLELLALSLIAGPLIALGELMIANIRDDEAPRIELQTTVEDKAVFKGKDGRAPPEFWNWNLRVAPWRGDGEPLNLPVSQAQWDRVRPGDRILFRPHPGRLGWVWYSPAERDAPGFVEVLAR